MYTEILYLTSDVFWELVKSGFFKKKKKKRFTYTNIPYIADMSGLPDWLTQKELFVILLVWKRVW